MRCLLIFAVFIHCLVPIALGDLNIDSPSLEALAKAGGGEYIHVRER